MWRKNPPRASSYSTFSDLLLHFPSEKWHISPELTVQYTMKYYTLTFYAHCTRKCVAEWWVTLRNLAEDSLAGCMVEYLKGSGSDHKPHSFDLIFLGSAQRCPILTLSSVAAGQSDPLYSKGSEFCRRDLSYPITTTIIKTKIWDESKQIQQWVAVTLMWQYYMYPPFNTSKVLLNSSEMSSLWASNRSRMRSDLSANQRATSVKS